MILSDSTISADGTIILPRFIPPNGDLWPKVQDWTAVEWTAWLRQSKFDDDAITRYLTQDRYRYGFGLLPDGSHATVANAEKATWLYLPTPKGITLHRTRELGVQNVMWGGAVGGTKSYSALWEAFICCETFQNCSVIIMRRELEELRRTHIEKAEKFAQMIDDHRPERLIRISKQPNAIFFEHTGSKIIFGHCFKLGDERKYMSEGYDLFIADQAEEFHPDQLVGVGGRLRSVEGIPDRAIYLPNPGGPAHLWLEDRFITHTVNPVDDPLYDPADYTFIPAQLYDNPWLMGRDGRYTRYEKRLMQHKPKRRKQLLDGDWRAVVGQFFEEYDADQVKCRVTLPPRCDVEVWFRSGEGGKVPYACWSVCLPDGRIHIVAELLMPHMTIGACAHAIVTATEMRVLPTLRGRWSRSIATSDIFPTENDKGESPIETCRRNGFYPLEGDTNELFGWQRLKHWFAINPLAGTTWLTISPDCPFMLRTLPTLVQDLDAPDLIDSSADTQAAHALRIGVMARPSPSLETIVKPKPPNGVGEIHSLIQQVIGRPSSRAGMVR